MKCLILTFFQDHPYLSCCFLPIRNQPFLIPSPLPSLNQLLSLKIPSFLHSPVTLSLSQHDQVATSRNKNSEPDEANDALNSNCNDDQPKTNRKIVIAGDSLLHRINSRKMVVNKIPSVKLTKRGDNLSGTVSRLTTYISKHSNVHLDIVLMAGTNDLSKRDVTPEVLIKELDDSITVIKRFSNVGQIFLCKIPQRFDHHNINTIVCLFNELLTERFLDTEDFLTVVDTVQPEIKFHYENGLHFSKFGISKLCGVILSKLYKILAPTIHRSRVSARPNRKAFVRGSSSSKQYGGSNSK